jgi:VWFA-related protein
MTPIVPGSACRRLVFPFLALTLAWTALPALAAAQEAPPAARFDATLDVDLVVLDVVAFDKRGNIVADLRADEIEVREDGEPVTLSSFEAPQPAIQPPAIQPPAEAPTAEAPAPLSPPPTAIGAAQPHLIVFVDNVHVGGANRDRFFRELWDFLETDVPPGTEILVAAHGRSLALLTPFTDDLDEVREGLEEAMRAPALGMLSELDQRSAIQAIAQRQRAAIDNPFEDPCPPDLGTLATHFASTELDRTSASIASLRFLTATLGGIDGSKSMLHVSDGLPLIPGQAVIEYAISLCDGTGSQQGVADAMDAESDPRRPAMLDTRALRLDLTRFSIEDDLRRVTELATANRVRLFTFQAAPPPSGGAEAADGLQKTRTGFSRFQEARNAEDSLHFLAEETGGRAFLAGTGFDRDLETTLDQITGSYSLSYLAPGERDGRSHRLEVTTMRPGVRILHPSHRTSKSVVDEVSDRLLAALHYGVTRELPGATVELTSSQPEGAPTRIRLRLPVESVTLPAPDGGRQGMLTLFLTALDEEGTSLGLRQRFHPIVLPPGDALPPWVVLEVEMGNDLTAHRVAVAVHDQLQATVWTLLSSGTS